MGRVAYWACVVLLTLAGHAAWPADPVWLRLQAPGFTVVSQLDEDDTRLWAVEFDQFVDALHRLYTIDELDLPPLTIVLFKDARAFAPYRNRTESGQADVAGFFGNMGTWSVIGLAGRRSTRETRRVIYHEAVHWFGSGAEVESPLWFEEGIAEVYSTFEVERGQGRWGMPVQSNVDYLRTRGLQPLEEFLRVEQDEALHGTDTFYPQAWAFLHYLMFGNGGAERTRLTELLRLQSQMDLDTAFATAFGRSYEEVARDLETYLERGQYGIAATPVRDRGADMSIEPASPGDVESALARLAVAGDNDELAERHARSALNLGPDVPAGYELLALLAQQSGDSTAMVAYLDRAIELGSSDANVYTARAFELLERSGEAPIDEWLPADAARQAADLLERSIALRPRDRDAYDALVVSLLNVDNVSDLDDAALATGRRALPMSGFVLVGLAALERQRGRVPEAARLLRQALAEPFEMLERDREAAEYLHDRWLFEWMTVQLQALMPEHRCDEARALLDEQLADASFTDRERTVFEEARREVVGFERLSAAVAAANSGRQGEAESALRELANDPRMSEQIRREAQRILGLASTR